MRCAPTVLNLALVFSVIIAVPHAVQAIGLEPELQPLAAKLLTLAFKPGDQPAVQLMLRRLATFSTRVCRAVVLNTPVTRTLSFRHGHTALLLVNEEQEAMFVSYTPVWMGYGPGELRLKVLTQPELEETLTQTGGVTDLVVSDGHVLDEPGNWQWGRYTKWISLTTDPVVYGPRMVAKAVDVFLHPGFFGVPFRDCDTIVRDIIAVDPGLAPFYRSRVFPNWSFDALAMHFPYFALPDIPLAAPPRLLALP